MFAGHLQMNGGGINNINDGGDVLVGCVGPPSCVPVSAASLEASAYAHGGLACEEGGSRQEELRREVQA